MGLPVLLEQVTPLLRRLERARFSSLAGRDSVHAHARIIDLCASGEVEAAATATRENWHTLERLLIGGADEHATEPAATEPAATEPGPADTEPKDHR